MYIVSVFYFAAMCSVNEYIKQSRTNALFSYITITIIKYNFSQVSISYMCTP